MGDDEELRWSWWRVLLHPIAAYDDLAETLQSASDGTFKEIGYTIVVALNVLLVLSKFALPQAWRLPFGVGLLALSLLFAVRFFSKKRSYQIFHRVGAQSLKSPNMHTTVTSPRKSSSESSAFGNDITAVSELLVWDPPIISQIVFCYFSPLQVAIVLAANDADTTASFFALVFALLIALSIRFMCQTYTTWKNDQAIIFKQAYDEQTRFMLSQTARPKADAAIQADSVDTTETSILYPAYPPVAVLVPPTPRQAAPRSTRGTSSAGVQTTPSATSVSSVQTSTHSGSSLSTPLSPTVKKRKKSTNPFQSGHL